MDAGAKERHQAVLEKYVARLVATCDFDGILGMHEWTFAVGN